MTCASCRAILPRVLRTPRALPIAQCRSPLRTSAALSQTPLLAQRAMLSTTRPRFSAAAAAGEGTEAEREITALLQEKLSPTSLLVQDVSGGCGSMYSIDIASPQFKGLSILKQQRLVNAALGDLVKSWHGLQLRTSVDE
ncbi:Putative BolA protein [[Torrubiella] hemipterigena]|uniref:Putative BolA protein n=1 Tax=[Torrubiella] hemipterigena TaxID=1531966 RepID=A0A0A1TAP5_9HYPO|nr:Putative BolA protein [[Torrubiella] hemipterigena]